MSNNIAQAFAAARAQGRAAFMPFFTGGFPDPETSLELLETLDGAGADLIEVGIPFSDPLADGPVIQHSSQMALDAGVTPATVLDLVGRASARVKAPLVLMTYYNPMLAMGLEEFAKRASRAGAAGVIIPDLPPEEAGPWLAAAEGRGLDTVFFAAPTTPPERLKLVTQATRGFLYYVSMTGVTGSDLELAPKLLAAIAEARLVCQLPVAVGFGVATPDQAAKLAKVADGVIVGSALVKLMLKAPGAEQGLAACRDLARGIAAALAGEA